MGHVKSIGPTGMADATGCPRRINGRPTKESCWSSLITQSITWMCLKENVQRLAHGCLSKNLILEYNYILEYNQLQRKFKQLKLFDGQFWSPKLEMKRSQNLLCKNAVVPRAVWQVAPSCWNYVSFNSIPFNYAPWHLHIFLDAVRLSHLKAARDCRYFFVTVFH